MTKIFSEERERSMSPDELRRSLMGGSSSLEPPPPPSGRTTKSGRTPSQTDLAGLYHLVSTTPDNHSVVWLAIDSDGKLAGDYNGGGCVGFLQVDAAGFVSGVMKIYNDRPGEITSQFGKTIPHDVEWPRVPLSDLQSGKAFRMQGVTISMMLRQGFPNIVEK